MVSSVTPLMTPAGANEQDEAMPPTAKREVDAYKQVKIQHELMKMQHELMKMQHELMKTTPTSRSRSMQ